MTGDVPLYQRDPDAWRAHLAEGNATQPRKRVGADMLICDQQGRILLVDPRYKPDWDLPGGMSEANEPPAATARREVKEELNLDLQPGRLLCIDWVSPHGPWDDSLMFIFYGGTLISEQITGLKLLDGELRSFDFCTEEQAADRLRPYVWQRAAHALQAQKTAARERQRAFGEVVTVLEACPASLLAHANVVWKHAVVQGHVTARMARRAWCGR